LFYFEISQVSSHKIEAQRFIFNMSAEQFTPHGVAKVQTYFGMTKKKR